MPEGLISTGPGNYLEVRLTATDSNGLSKTVIRDVQPNRVDVSFATNPSGLSMLINGETFTTPKTLVSWEGYSLNVNAPSPQTLSGTTYAFCAWSDGKGQQHTIVTGAALVHGHLHGHLHSLHEDRNFSRRDPQRHLRSDVICAGRQRHHRGWEATTSSEVKAAPTRVVAWVTTR